MGGRGFTGCSTRVQTESITKPHQSRTASCPSFRVGKCRRQATQSENSDHGGGDDDDNDDDGTLRLTAPLLTLPGFHLSCQASVCPAILSDPSLESLPALAMLLAFSRDTTWATLSDSHALQPPLPYMPAGLACPGFLQLILEHHSRYQLTSICVERHPPFLEGSGTPTVILRKLVCRGLDLNSSECQRLSNSSDLPRTPLASQTTTTSPSTSSPSILPPLLARQRRSSPSNRSNLLPGRISLH
ncbi:hypothetical protein BV25DRAFT_963584 [Artomyces pyxidatus]|uniref:Uncharacterized protein n=1 Tax=Artomyces pyxidatus TaxID=48021 RepID=A0ACB8SVH6_9AGAM|nr:hypothetical protein BV25DRAFT_963584 [Artomyces pyxidatus]